MLEVAEHKLCAGPLLLLNRRLLKSEKLSEIYELYIGECYVLWLAEVEGCRLNRSADICAV